MENIVVLPARLTFPVKLVLLDRFWISIDWLFFIEIYRNHPETFFDFFWSFHMLLCHFYYLVQLVFALNDKTVAFYIYLWRNYTKCVLSWPHCYQMVKQKTCCILKNSDQPDNLDTGFVPVLILLIDICSSWLFILTLILTLPITLHCLELTQLLLRRKLSYLLS